MKTKLTSLAIALFMLHTVSAQDNIFEKTVTLSLKNINTRIHNTDTTETKQLAGNDTILVKNHNHTK